MSVEEFDALEAEETEDEELSEDSVVDESSDADSSDEKKKKKKKKKKKHHHDDEEEGDEKKKKKKKKKKKHHHDDEEEGASSDGKKHILIVEDERPLAHALELKLSHDGYETTTASTGTDGLEHAKNGRFDLMLLDLILPGMDGFELLRSLKESGSKLPVVILSNLGQEEDKARVQDYGVAQYCVKSNMPLAAIVSTVKVLTS